MVRHACSNGLAFLLTALMIGRPATVAEGLGRIKHLPLVPVPPLLSGAIVSLGLIALGIVTVERRLGCGASSAGS